MAWDCGSMIPKSQRGSFALLYLSAPHLRLEHIPVLLHTLSCVSGAHSHNSDMPA